MREKETETDIILFGVGKNFIVNSGSYTLGEENPCFKAGPFFGTMRFFLGKKLLEQIDENMNYSRNMNKTAEELYEGWNDDNSWELVHYRKE